MTQLPAERILSSNLAALSACDPDLARRIAAAAPRDGQPSAVVRPARCGWPTIITSGSRPLHIHSAEDPVSEAALQAGRVPADARRIMVLGFGAAHLLATLLTRPSLGRLDVVPLNAGVLHAVATTLDLKPLLCDPRVRFVQPESLQLVAPFVVVPPLLKLAEAPLLPLRTEAEDALAIESVRRQKDAYQPAWEAAQRSNQALVQADRSVGLLTGKHTGAVAVVALAGPSLAEALPLLRPALGAARRALPCRLVLVAEEQALPLLWRGGVTPDYVVTMGLPPQPHRMMLMPLPTSITLVYTPSAAPELLRAWRGPRLCSAPQPEAVLLGTGGTAGLWADGSTAHMAVDLARAVGAHPVMLLGADMTGTSSAGGADRQRQVTAVGGGLTSASVEQVATRRALEGYLARHPDLVPFNCSPTGARIAGTVEKPLLETLRALDLATEEGET